MTIEKIEIKKKELNSPSARTTVVKQFFIAIKSVHTSRWIPQILLLKLNLKSFEWKRI